MPVGIGGASKGTSSTGSSASTTAVNTSASSSTFVVVIQSQLTNTIDTPTDNFGNVYTLLRNLATAPVQQAKVYECINGIGGTNHVVTSTIVGTGVTAYFLEITGALTVAPSDGENGIMADVSPYLSPSITTTQADDLLVGYFCGGSGANPATHTISGASPATGWAILAAAEEVDGTLYWPGCLAHRLVSATGTYNSGFTEAAGGDSYAGILTYKAAPEASQYAPRQRRLFVPGRRPGVAQFTRRRSNAYTAAEDILTVSGSLLSDVATASGAVAVNIAASGALASAAAVMAGTIAVNIDASGSLVSQAAAVSGNVSIQVDVSGALAAAASTLAGNVAVNIGASGSLVSSAAALAGSVAVNIDASGALAAQAATMAGSVAVNIAGSGALAAQAAALAGNITNSATETLQFSEGIKATNTDLQGNITTSVAVSGNLAAQAASVTGAASIIITVSGSLVAAISRAAGAADTSHSTSGALASQRGTMAGNVSVRNDFSGELQSARPGMAGDIAVAVMPRFAGSLETQPSKVAGTVTWSVSMVGSLQAQPSKVDLTLRKHNQGSETGAHHPKGNGGRFLEFFVRRRT